MIEATEIWRTDQLRPNPWLPQRKQYPMHVLVDKTAWGSLRAMRPAFYVARLALGSQKTERTSVVVDPGFALCMITGLNSAAAPADGLGASQLMIFDPARRLRFSRVPLVSPILFGIGTGPFMLHEPYVWTGGNKAPIQIQIQNRAAAANTVTLVLIGRVPQ